MIVICSFLSLSGYFTRATEVTQSHYNRLNTQCYWQTPLQTGRLYSTNFWWWLHLHYEFFFLFCFVVEEISLKKKRKEEERRHFVSTQFSSLFVQASLNIVLSVVGMQTVQHVLKCALISLGNVCYCVRVAFVKYVLFTITDINYFCYCSCITVSLIHDCCCCCFKTFLRYRTISSAQRSVATTKKLISTRLQCTDRVKCY